METKEEFTKKVEKMSLDEQTNLMEVEKTLVFRYYVSDEKERERVFDIFSGTVDEYETDAHIGRWAKDMTFMILNEFGIKPKSLFCDEMDDDERKSEHLLAQITMPVKENMSIRSITKLLEEHPDHVPSILYDDTKIWVQIGFEYFPS